MPLTDLVTPNAIIPALKVNGKKRRSRNSRARREADRQKRTVIFETLMQREKLGAPGLAAASRSAGKLPQAREAGRVVRAARPSDRLRVARRQPVDLIFLLLARRLPARITSSAGARRASAARGGGVAKLRESRDADALYAVLALRSSNGPKRGARPWFETQSPRPSGDGPAPHHEA